MRNSCKSRVSTRNSLRLQRVKGSQIKMDQNVADQFLKFLKELTNKNAAVQPTMHISQFPLPQPLEVEEGDMSENFNFFKDSWDTYCVANGMDKWVDEEARKVSILLTAIGIAAMKKYAGFQLTAENKETTESVLNAIKAKVVVEPNVVYERFIFHCCNQSPDESFEAYYRKLVKLVKTCKFAAMEQELLRDRIIFGINNLTLKKKLMEIKDPPLEVTIEKCKIDELQNTQFKKMVCADDQDRSVQKVTHTERINANKDSGFKRKAKPCKFCAGFHKWKKEFCPAYGKQCSECKVDNHFSNCCPTSKSRASSSNKSDKKHKVKEVAVVSESSEDEEFKDLIIGRVRKVAVNSSIGKQKKDPKRVELKLWCSDKWKNVMCELDSGADCCLIGWKSYCKMMNVTKPNLSAPKYRLQAINGTAIPCKGQTVIQCSEESGTVSINFFVVEVDHGPLLSEEACVALGLINYSDRVVGGTKSVKSVQKEKVDSAKPTSIDVNCEGAKKIVQRYQNVFEGYGKLAGEVHLEIDNNVPPVIQPARRVPMAFRNHLKDELQKLVNDGIIVKEVNHTDWVSNIVCVKKGESFRICLDPIPLNKALKRPNYQTTTIDEVLPELGKVKVFSTVDAKKGYWQLALDEPSSKLTTFWTPFGRYRWLRLPFGLSASPDHFQMKMFALTHDLKGVEVLVDDLLVIGSGENMELALKDHNQNLENLLERLQQNNCKLNKQKMVLCKTSVKFFGHVLTDKGLQADPAKLEAIRNMPSPQNKKDLQRFIGMMNYLSRYIKDLSTHATVLRELAKESSIWKWSQAEEEEFVTMKSIVADVKKLKYFDVNKPVVIECDASGFGLGAALFQDDNVIAYASRTLKPAEKNYAQIEKECLAVVFACTHFDQMIVGNVKTTVRTDHKPLIPIFAKPLLKAPKRLQLMLMVLQRYNVHLEFVKGTDNIVADTLSRAPVDSARSNSELPNCSIYKVMSDIEVSKFVEHTDLTKYLQITDERIRSIQLETSNDETMQRLMQTIITGWPRQKCSVPDDIKVYYKHKDELTTQNGLVFRNDRIVIPHILRKLMLKKIHVAHNGIDATLRFARENLFWPGMSTDIKHNIEQCDICMKYSSSQPKPPMLSHEIPVLPFQFVSMDVLSATYKGKQENFLVTVDHYSDFFELDQLENLSAAATIRACKRNFSRHGIPQRVCSDNGTNFYCKEFRDFAREWEFEHVTSAPHHQQANGKAEATVKIAKRLIKKCNESGKDLWFCLLHWRNTPKLNQSSPVQRIFSRRTRTAIPTSTANLLPNLAPEVSNQILQQRRKSKFYYDRATRVLPALRIGQPVAVQLNLQKEKLWTKGIVEKILSDRSYEINVDGATYRRDIVHIKPHPTLESPNASPQSAEDTISPNSQRSPTRPPSQQTQQQSIDQSFIQDSRLEENRDIAVESAEVAPPITANTISDRPKRTTKLPSHFKDFQMYK